MWSVIFFIKLEFSAGSRPSPCFEKDHTFWHPSNMTGGGGLLHISGLRLFDISVVDEKGCAASGRASVAGGKELWHQPS